MKFHKEFELFMNCLIQLILNVLFKVVKSKKFNPLKSVLFIITYFLKCVLFFHKKFKKSFLQLCSQTGKEIAT
uniref:Uncharacterized protein n=1 Tax=Anguilla anguilla TaxID=7936 RepID=A0A0E9VQ41_ANGAN